MKCNIGYLLVVLLFSVSGCKQNTKVLPADQYHNGHIVIACDNDFRYVMEQQREVFEAIYPGASITFDYMSDAEIMKKLYKRELQEAVIGRQLTAEESEALTRIDSTHPREHLMAKDALAFIVGNKSPIKSLNYERLFSNEQQMLNNDNFTFVFDGKQTSLVKSFQLFSGVNKSLKVFALDSIEAVIDYVNQHDGAIGAIPYAKISDEDNPQMQQLLKNVNIISVEKKDSTGRTTVSVASEADISIGAYPFIRPLNYVICNPYERVGTGFANFIFKKQGQKIFLKAGLIPTTMPERDFIINSNGVDVKK
ncbi:MAG: substrate-binding domain-containing protein [Chitinophagales bacterium]